MGADCPGPHVNVISRTGDGNGVGGDSEHVPAGPGGGGDIVSMSPPGDALITSTIEPPGGTNTPGVLVHALTNGAVGLYAVHVPVVCEGGAGEAAEGAVMVNTRVPPAVVACPGRF